MSDGVKSFYEIYHDRIFDKRYNSPFWLRRYAHRTVYERILRHIQPGQTVLDVGCGEGVLLILIAQKRAFVTGVDLSAQNVAAARRRASELDTAATFIVGDAEELPFADSCFDLVVSSHVMEHLPNPAKGLSELQRVTKGPAVIAMPTCLNPAAWALLGGDNYWLLSKRSLLGIPLGFLRTLAALVRGDEGPQEGYAGHNELPHVWRFPWAMIRMIRSVGFGIERFEAGPLIIPYLPHYLAPVRRLQTTIDQWGDLPVLKYLGYGSQVVCHKIVDGRD